MTHRLLFPVALLLMSVTVPLAAQETLTLDQAMVNRLGLVFARLAPADDSSGTRFPAAVITSPQAASQVPALYGGVLERWTVSPGTPVRAGDELAVLRSSAVLDLQQQWRQAQAVAEQAEVSLARDRRLLEAGVIAEQRLRDSERGAAVATFQRDSLAAALGRVGYATDDLRTLAGAGSGLGLYHVRAPTDGMVGSLDHRAGEAIEAGEILLRLNSDELWLSAEIPAAVATRLAVGQTFGLASADATLELRQIARAINTQTQTVELLAVFTAAADLLPGQIVTLLVPPRADGMLVPAEAVVHSGNDTVVYVRVPGGVEARTLTLQPAGGDYLATDGVAAGEEVVVRGAALLKGITLGLGGE